MYEFSDNIKWINTDKTEFRKRRMRALKEIYLLNKDSTKLTHDNILDNYYPNRPDTMKNMSLYAFVSNYEYKRLLCHENCLTLKNNFGFMHKRTSKQLVKFANIRPVDSESIDNYYHQLLFLFKPWQDEKKDLLSGHKNYLEAFNFAIENNLLDTEVFNQYTEQKETPVETGVVLKVISTTSVNHYFHIHKLWNS